MVAVVFLIVNELQGVWAKRQEEICCIKRYPNKIESYTVLNVTLALGVMLGGLV